MQKFWSFLLEVGKHWTALATGGIIMAGVWVGKDIFGMNVPPWVNVVLANLFWLLACFFAWRDQYDKTRTLTRPVQINDALDAFQERGRQLAKDAGNNRWRTKARTDAWIKDLVNFGLANLTTDQVGALRQQTGLHEALEFLLTVTNDQTTKENIKLASRICDKIYAITYVRMTMPFETSK